MNFSEILKKAPSRIPPGALARISSGNSPEILPEFLPEFLSGFLFHGFPTNFSRNYYRSSFRDFTGTSFQHFSVLDWNWDLSRNSFRDFSRNMFQDFLGVPPVIPRGGTAEILLILLILQRFQKNVSSGIPPVFLLIFLLWLRGIPTGTSLAAPGILQK